MKHSEKLLATSNALQPVLFASKHAMADAEERAWRIAEFTRRDEAGDFLSLQDGEDPAALRPGRHPLSDEDYDATREAAIRATSDLSLKFHQMQLLAYMLNGAIHAVLHDSDMVDGNLTESMLFCANMRLSSKMTKELCDAVEDFVRQTGKILGPEFNSAEQRILLKDVELLKAVDLWERH